MMNVGTDVVVINMVGIVVVAAVITVVGDLVFITSIILLMRPKPVRFKSLVFIGQVVQGWKGQRLIVVIRMQTPFHYDFGQSVRDQTNVIDVGWHMLEDGIVERRE
jgi:hypothetical protein